jgi:hypothetical protein
MTKEIDPKIIKELLDYDPETGKLFWKKRLHGTFDKRGVNIFNTKFAGKEALTTKTTHGYHDGTIFNKKYSAHRIAWVLYYGEWPKGHIDHINHNGRDNRIKNLRDVTRSENMRNAQLSGSNTSGVTGVYYRKSEKRWIAAIGSGSKFVHIGIFKNKDDAISARKKAEAEYGFHPNHGRASA